MLKDSAHNSVASAVDFDTNFLTARRPFNVANFVRCNRPIFELDALSDIIQVIGLECLVQHHVVNLAHLVTRVCQALSQITVVGEHQKTGGHSVQATHRINTLWPMALNELHDRFAVLRVIHCCDEIFRLVQKHIHFAFWRNAFIVKAHLIVGLHFVSHLGHHLAIDLNQSCGNKVIRLTARCYSCVRQIFIQAGIRTSLGIVLLGSVLSEGLAFRITSAPCIGSCFKGPATT